MPGAKNIDPHWSRDGRSLYFIADADQISNVYRLDVAGGTIYQITRETTGVSGITPLSPALSVAGQADRAAFSVYRAGNYEIHAIDLAVDSAMTLAPIATGASTKPLSEARPTGGAFAAPTFDLPNGKGFAVKPYRAGSLSTGWCSRTSRPAAEARADSSAPERG